MRIARVLIDARPLTNKYRGRGVGNYTQSLLNLLLQETAVEWHVIAYGERTEFINTLFGSIDSTLRPNFEFYSLGKPNTPLERLSAPIYSKLKYLPLIKKSKPDAILCLEPDLGISKKIPTIAVVHDIIPYKLNRYSEKNALINHFNRKNYLWWMSQLQRAEKIITISEFTKNDLVQYGLDESKIVVTPLALPQNFANSIVEATTAINTDTEHHKRRVLNIYNLTEPYIVYYGGLEPNKNVGQVLRAFSNLTSIHPDLKLAIIGGEFKLGWDHKAVALNERALEIERIAAELKIRHKIIFTGFVENKHLPVLLKNSKCLVHLSLYEGFGLTLLEAQAAGTPVIAADRSSYPEVVGESAVLVDPDDLKQISEAISRFVNNDSQSLAYREQFIAKGNENLKRFSWEKTATATLALVETALKPRDKVDGTTKATVEANNEPQIEAKTEVKTETKAEVKTEPGKKDAETETVSAAANTEKEAKKPQAVVMSCYFAPLRGGVEQYALDYAKMLLKLGYEVTVITSDRKQGQVLIPVLEVPTEYGAIKLKQLKRVGNNHYLYWLKGAFSTLKEIQPELIHRHGLGHLAFDLAISRYKSFARKNNLTVKTIITPHDPIMPRVEKGGRKIFKFIFNMILSTYYRGLFDRVIAVNSEQYKWLSSTYRIAEEKIRISPPVMPGASLTLKKLRKIKDSKDHILIASVGRLTKYKGYADLIAAFNEINTSIQTRLIIAGAKDPYERELRDIAARSPRHDDISVETDITDERRTEIFRQADIFATASHSEAFGISTAEAMAEAAAVVASDTEGSRYLIKQGVNGYIFKMGDFRQLTSEIDKLIKDKELLIKMQENAYAKADEFTFEKLLAGYSRIIAEL